MTITSNIHPNLSAWVSQTYSVGNRRSNVGNAYECTTAGSSTGAPTGTGSHINNGGVAYWKYLSAIDFTDLNSWWLSQPATLTDNIVALAWNNGTFTVSPGSMFLDGGANSVTTGSFTVTLGCAPGESWRDKPGPIVFDATRGVSFTAPSTGTVGQYLYCPFNNLILDGWQIRDPNGPGGAIVVNMANANATLRNCLIDTDVGSIAYIPAANGVLYNCALIDRSTSQIPVNWDASATGGKAVNCLLIAVNGNTGSGGFFTDGTAAGSVLIRNSIAFGYSRPLFCQNIAGAIVVDHCCTDVAAFDTSTAGFGCTDNGGEQFSKTAANQFINVATDFRLKAGSSCSNNGTPDTTDVPAADDVFHTHRPQGSSWDIGPFEMVTSIPYHPVMQSGPQLAT